MALATICPHCNTMFRVASDQLKLRGGIVRCGACNEVFDGNAALVDAAARQADQPAPVEQPAPPAPSPVPAGPSASDAFDAEIAEIEAKETEEVEEPVFTLDFDTTFDPFGILPKQEPEPEPEVKSEPEPETELELESDEPEPEPQPESDPAVDEEIVALPAPDDDEPIEPPVHDDNPDSIAPFLTRASAAAEPTAPAAPPLPAAPSSTARRAAKRNKVARPAPLAVPAEVVDARDDEPASDEPEFVRRSRLQEQSGRNRRIVMAIASVLLLLALAAQAVTTFRNVLAARFPQGKPVLSATCAVFGCKVELPAQIDTLSVETGELQSLGGNAFSYTTLLRNPGSLAQAWPHIELALTDADDKPLVRRVFTPTQYLPPAVAAAKGFGPRTEQPVKLFFELKQIKASGYHIAIFYP
jgi:predicted Zn finger-like uncharacterized protein